MFLEQRYQYQKVSNSERSEQFLVTECFFNFSYLINQNNQNSNWKKILGFGNTQEKLENTYTLLKSGCFSKLRQMIQDKIHHQFEASLWVTSRKYDHNLLNTGRVEHKSSSMFLPITILIIKLTGGTSINDVRFLGGKVSYFQNEFMKSSFLPKYERKIVRISALTIQYRTR